MFNLEFGSLVLVQFSLQQLLSHFNLGLEAIWILVALIGFGWVLVERLSVRSGRAGLPLSSKHNGVPKFQPLEQTAVGKLQRKSHTQPGVTNSSTVHKRLGFIITEGFYLLIFTDMCIQLCRDITYVITQKLCVVPGRKSVHPETRGSALSVFRILILFIFSLRQYIIHTATRSHKKTIKKTLRMFTFLMCVGEKGGGLPGQQLREALRFLHNLLMTL